MIGYLNVDLQNKKLCLNNIIYGTCFELIQKWKWIVLDEKDGLWVTSDPGWLVHGFVTPFFLISMFDIFLNKKKKLFMLKTVERKQD